ncbi:hypothetical protein TNCV_3807631 [Trichonephila clavipes]|nr:hypothetical protein TNCV_3807631 [Trichonephila clavipes]
MLLFGDVTRTGNHGRTENQGSDRPMETVQSTLFAPDDSLSQSRHITKTAVITRTIIWRLSKRGLLCQLPLTIAQTRVFL